MKKRWMLALGVAALGAAFALTSGGGARRDDDRALRAVVAGKALQIWERTGTCPSKYEALDALGIRGVRGRPMTLVCGVADNGFRHVVLIDRQTGDAHAY